jgi:septum formation protein
MKAMKPETPCLVLASASPRRRRILAALGVPCEALVPRVRERHTGRDPRGAARANALRKNAWAAARRPGRCVLSADTVVVLDGRGLGKPESRAEARSFLRRLSGRTHEVVTAVALRLPGRGVRSRLAVTRVTFRPLDARRIRAYLSRVNPLDKAGGYDLGHCGAMLVAGCDGSPSNVRGLPAEVVGEWLRRYPEIAS